MIPLLTVLGSGIPKRLYVNPTPYPDKMPNINVTIPTFMGMGSESRSEFTKKLKIQLRTGFMAGIITLH